MTLKFSIVTPSYNKGAYIDKTIRSVLSQLESGNSSFELEYFIFDGCSTDNTVEILKAYEDDARVSIQTRKDLGQFDAINTGWIESTGDILGWINADDVYLDRAFCQLADFFETHPDVMAIYGEAVYINDSNRVIKPVTNIRDYSQKRLLSHDFITQPSTFIRREVFDEVGLLDGQYRYVFDWDYWIRISQKYSFFRVPILLSGYRITGENLTTLGGKKRLKEMLEVVWKYGGSYHMCLFVLRLMLKYSSGKTEIPSVD